MQPDSGPTAASAPKTLRQMAGAPIKPPSLDESALLVIDAQREYLDGQVPLPDIQQALDKIDKLLAAARSLGRPVIHIAHIGASGGLFDPDSGGRIISQVDPLPGEVVVEKSLPNSFANTSLREEISKLGDPHLVLCGFMTHMCVSSTARAATDLGLTTTVVTDASGTRPLPSPDDSQSLSHQSLHQASLAALSDRFSFLASTDDMVTP